MISKIIIIGWTLFIGWAFLAGMADVHDTNPSKAVSAFVLMFSVFFHLGIWMLVALPTYMISRMFRRRDDAAPAEIRRRPASVS